jgi:hypothetical protein
LILKGRMQVRHKKIMDTYPLTLKVTDQEHGARSFFTLAARFLFEAGVGLYTKLYVYVKYCGSELDPVSFAPVDPAP